MEPNAFVYDDIIIISNTIEEHSKIQKKIFNRLFENGLTVSQEKCHFCRPELRNLGYVVDEFGLRVDPAKAILRIPAPKTVKEVRDNYLQSVSCAST